MLLLAALLAHLNWVRLLREPSGATQSKSSPSVALAVRVCGAHNIMQQQQQGVSRTFKELCCAAVHAGDCKRVSTPGQSNSKELGTPQHRGTAAVKVRGQLRQESAQDW